MADNEVKIIITGDSKSATKALQDVTGALKNTGTQSTTTGGTLASLKTSYLAVAAAAVVVVREIKACITEAAAQETADNNLAQSLRNVGAMSAESFNNLKNFATELQNTTTQGDDASEALMSLGLNFGISTAKIKEATEGAIGLEKMFRAAGMTTETAMKGIAGAYQGSFMALSRYIPELRTAVDRTERMAIVSKLMADGFIAAKGETETFSGKVKQMNNALGDVREEIGMILIPLLLPMIQKIKELAVWFAGLPQPIKTAAVALVGLAIAIKGISIAAAFLNLNPVVLAITGVAAIVMITTSAMKKMQDQSRSSAGALEDLATIERTLASAQEQRLTLAQQIIDASNEQERVGRENALKELDNNIAMLELKIENQRAEVERRKELEQQAADNSFSIEQELENKRIILGEAGASRKERFTARDKAIADAQERGAKINADKEKQRLEAIFNFKKQMADAGVRATVDAASSEKATIGSVSAAIIESLASALAESMTIKAIAALASGNFVGAAGLFQKDFCRGGSDVILELGRDEPGILALHLRRFAEFYPVPALFEREKRVERHVYDLPDCLVVVRLIRPDFAAPSFVQHYGRALGFYRFTFL